MEAQARKPYPTDVSDEEWAFVAPYLALLPEDAGQRRYEVREVFNALRWIVRAGAPWRLLPTNFPPWPAVYQQTQRWIAAGCFEAIVHDLRMLVRLATGRQPDPSAVTLDSRTLQSTPESGHRAGYDGAKPAQAAAEHGIRLEVVKHTEAKRGFVLLPRRWVVERSFAWTARFRRLARDYERLPQTVATLHFIAFACLLLHRLFSTFTAFAA